jgi:hypothetical protein
MNGKIKTKQRHLYKVLDVVSDYKDARRGVVHIDDSFFKKMHPLNRTQVTQALNALQSEDVVEILPSNISPYHICVQLTCHAFAYRMHLRETSFRFWFPSVVSLIAIIISSISAAPTILNLLQQFLQLLQ